MPRYNPDHDKEHDTAGFEEPACPECGGPMEETFLGRVQALWPARRTVGLTGKGIGVGGYWKVGRANDPMPEDTIYSTEADAIERAQKMADAYGFYQPVGVWDRDGEPVWLFMLGEQFRRV